MKVTLVECVSRAHQRKYCQDVGRFGRVVLLCKPELAAKPWFTLRRGHTPPANIRRGYSPPKLFIDLEAMRELSVFLDESGDFGPYEPHSPTYILGMVFHDQSDDISVSLDHIHRVLIAHKLPGNHAIHTGPLIRRERDYSSMGIDERRQLFRVLFNFVRNANIRLEALVLDKRNIGGSDELFSALGLALGNFIREHQQFFDAQDRVVIYYDNGQKEITNLVNTVFSAMIGTVEVRRVLPSSYTLFQAADLCCTLELLRVKMINSSLSKSERDFFTTKKASGERALRKYYLKTLDAMRL